MVWKTISPQGGFEAGLMKDDDGQDYIVLRLPENDGSEGVELVFTRASFVTYTDWLSMIADTVISEMPPSVG